MMHSNISKQTDRIIQTVLPVLRDDGRILAAYLLGSAAAGTLRSDSDIDIALMVQPSKTLGGQALFDLAGGLTECAGRWVDLGVIASCNLVYASEAILTGRRFFCRDVYQADLNAATLLGLAAQLRYERREIVSGYTD